MTAKTLVRKKLDWRKVPPRAIESPQRMIDGKLPPTLGPAAVQWMQSRLEHGPGDLLGHPYLLDPYQVRFLYRLLEYHPETGDFLANNALLGVAQGNAKTEFAAAVASLKFAGPAILERAAEGWRPSVHPAPDIPILAAAFEQANLLYGAARLMVTPIGNHLEIYDNQMLRRQLPGRMYRVAAVGGTNDGRRPSDLLIDEYHELVGQKADADLRLRNKLTKRGSVIGGRRPQAVAITTAGWDRDGTPCGLLYQRGIRLSSGEVDDQNLLFVWYQAEDHWDLDKPAELRAAIRQANPATWVDADRLAQRLEVDGLPEYEFRRYYLNQWTQTSSQWLPSNAWPKLADPREVPDGADVVLGFDGSYNRDATGLIGWTEIDGSPYGFVVGHWENPHHGSEWRVPRHEVQVTLREAFRTWRIVELACDPWRWESEIDGWVDDYGPVVVEVPTNSARRMTQACARFYSAVVQGAIAHDGDGGWARHIANAVVKETRDGAYITKDGRNSPRKIDLAVAGVIGYDRFMALHEQPVDPLTQIW